MDSDLWKVIMELKLNTWFLIFLLGLTSTAFPSSPPFWAMRKEQVLLIELEKQLQKMTPKAEKYGQQVEMKPGSGDARKLITYSNKVNEAMNPIHLFSLAPTSSPPPAVSITLRRFWPEYIVEKCLQFPRKFYWKHQSCYWRLIYLEQRTLNLLKYMIWMLTLKMYNRIRK